MAKARTPSPEPRAAMLKNVGASAACIAAAVVVFNPLDCLRVRWQVEPPGGAPNLLAFAQRTIRTEGVSEKGWGGRRRRRRRRRRRSKCVTTVEHFTEHFAGPVSS